MSRLGARGRGRSRSAWTGLGAILAGGLLSVSSLPGCYDSRVRGDTEPGDDGSIDERDAESGDAGWDDAGSGDAGHVLDAGRDASIGFDGGPRDGGMVFDAGRLDGGIGFDGGPRDGGPRDGGPRDGGPRDGGPRDGGPRDGGPRDGGVRLDAGRPDSGRRDSGVRPDSGRPDGGIDAGIDAGRPRSIALRFAPDDRVTIPDRPGLSVAADTTYELWIRARGPGTATGKGNDGGQQHHIVRVEGTGDASELVVGWATVDGARRELRAPFGPNLGRWTHVAFVVARTADGRLRQTLYVDLVALATAEVPDDTGRAFNLEPLLLGRFDGDLDEVRIWNTVRSLDSLAANAFRRIPGGTAGLAAYWSIEEGAGQILLDRSLRGSDGILGDRTTPDAMDPTWITDGAFP